MRFPTLGALPPPPPGRTGWPWTEESPHLPETMPDGSPWPRISIVTPSYSQGQFIEETIRSVLLQGYPNLEYIIMDGGSTDNSVEIIKRYEKYLTYWVSRPDRGQAHAINEGLKMASGQWFNWLNSDDMLMPRALMTLAEIANIASDAEWIAGGSLFMSEKGAYVEVNIPWRTDPTLVGLDMLSFPQDATFVKIEFVKKAGIKLREDLHNVFDTVFHIELFQVGRPVLTNAIFSAMRLHPQQKTANVTRRTHESSIAIEPLRRKWPPFNRLILRLLRTRFSKLGTTLLRFAVWYGLTPSSRKWRAVAFIPGDFTWRVTSARQLIW